MKIKITIFIIAALTLIFAVNSCIIFFPSESSTSENQSPDKTSEAVTVVEEEPVESPEINKEEENNDTKDYSDQIKVSTPTEGQIIKNPLIITGEARGTWFFEATFPVRLIDSNGNEIALHYAQAEGEWMTEDFVPFKSQIEFDRPDTSEGVLILEKNNPSDMREYDAQIEIHVRFE
jgi:hypothetical protein